MTKSEDSLPGLYSKFAALTTERDESFDLSKETAETLSAAGADIALQTTHWEAAREETDTHTGLIAKFQEQLTANAADLPQLPAKPSALIDELNRV